MTTGCQISNFLNPSLQNECAMSCYPNHYLADDRYMLYLLHEVTFKLCCGLVFVAEELKNQMMLMLKEFCHKKNINISYDCDIVNLYKKSISFLLI